MRRWAKVPAPAELDEEARGDELLEGPDELLEPGESRTSFLLRFTLNHPGMSTNIVGTKSPVHLEDNATAAKRGPLSADVYAEAKRRLDAADRIAVSLAYYKISGRSGIKEDGVTGMVSVRF